MYYAFFSTYNYSVCKKHKITQVVPGSGDFVEVKMNA
jgi:hypothetical protein